jgi:hypothetical protein
MHRNLNNCIAVLLKQRKQQNPAMLFVVALCVVASMGFFSHTLAATTSSAVVQLPSNLVLVGTVSIQNATITKQVANTFTVDFDLANQTGAQPDLRYGILLLQQSGKLQSAIDTKVYSETVSLAENDSEHITATYTAPDFLAGNYLLAVQVKNGDGFPMGTAILGPVTLHGSSQYVSVNGSSCYLTIPQDAAVTHYAIGQGVDLLPSEDLIAHCDVTNTSNAAMTVTPTFTTYYRSVFGAIVSSSTQSPVTLAPGEATLESFTIPKPTDPQAYDTVLTFLDAQGNQISNSMTFHYVIHGPSATIQNLVFDKDSYQPGDTAKLSFFWTGAADGFLGSRLGPTNEGTITVNVQMTNAQGVSCANDYSEPLKGQSAEVVIAIPVAATCVNPVAKLTLSDVAGNILASSSLLVQTKTNQAQGWPLAAEWALWLVLLIIVVVFLVFLFRGKEKSAKIMGLLIIIGSLVTLGIGRATMSHAMRYIPPVGDGGEYVINPEPVPAPTYFACVNNACTKVAGTGTDQCSTLGATCNSRSISTSTYLACSNNSCVAVPGNSQNEGGCSNLGDSCNSQTEGIAAIAFDISLDNTQYAPNGTIVGSGDFDYTLCDNGSELGANDLEIDMTINGVTEPIVTYNDSTWDVYYTGSPLATGSNDFTAPSTPGSYSAAFTLTANWNDVGGSNYQATQSGSIPYQVVSGGGPVSGPSSTGVVNVMSEDSQTGSAVTSSFDVLDGGSDLCDPSGFGAPCTAQTESFTNAPLGIAATVVAQSGSAGPQYALREVKEEYPIAQKGNSILGVFFALSRNLLIPVVDAQTYCGYLDSSSSQCALPYTLPSQNSLTPTASDPTANFVILWDPEASISVSPPSVSNTLSSAGTVGQVTISNTSNAPGSELGWSSSVSYTNGNNWLSVTPSADATGIGSGSSETATIAYTGGLSPGTYQANVTFTGNSISGGSLNQPPSIPVTLTVTSGSGGPYFSCASNQCAETVTPGATSCDAACGLPSGTTPAATCAPNSITTAQTSQCMLDLNGMPQNNVAWAIASGSSGSVNNSGVYTPSGTGTETIVGTLPDGTSADATVTVTVPPLPTCNSGSCQATCDSPTLNANPASIVVPESSSLTYGCSHVTECQLTGGDLPGFVVYPPSGLDTISGSVSTAPSIATTYTLTCVNGDYSSDSASASVQVTVGGSSLCEQNPNGAGCQGQ